jgi:polyferredoxin
MAAAERISLPPRAEIAPGPPGIIARKPLVRRIGRDYSQLLRCWVQGLFLALNIYIGIQFYFFVRYFESGGLTPRVSRPAGVEGWLPIAGLMNLKYFFLTGKIPSIHPAAMVLLIGFLLISVIFRKAFCGWLCPVGSLSELVWKVGRKILKQNWVLPRWLDIPLRSLKYLLLAFFGYAVAGMSVSAIDAFLNSPYGLVADVKMLDFFRYLGSIGVITLLTLLLLSFFYQNFWCRYLCPYGALTGLAALFSPSRIRRDPQKCIDCSKCAKACPALLAVDKQLTVRSAECMACMECVAVCPAEVALEMSLPMKRRLPVWSLAAGVAIIFLGVVAIAKLTGAWNGSIPDEIYRQYLPVINELSHP